MALSKAEAKETLLNLIENDEIYRADSGAINASTNAKEALTALDVSFHEAGNIILSATSLRAALDDELPAKLEEKVNGPVIGS